MQEISVPFTNATGSMLFRLATRFMTRITTTSFAPLTALKKWLRCSMLFMQVMTGAAAHAKTLFAASKPALKQWWIYHQKAWKVCGCNHRLHSFTRRVLSVSKFGTMKYTTFKEKPRREHPGALETILQLVTASMTQWASIVISRRYVWPISRLVWVKM